MDLREKISLAPASTLRFFFINGTVIILQIYFESLSGSSFQIGLIQSALWGGILVFSPFWGSLADKTGRSKGILLSTMIIGALLIPFLGFSENIWFLLMILTLISIFTSSFQPIILSITSKNSSKEKRGSNMSIYNSSRSLGIAAGRFFAGILLSLFIFRDIFWIYFVVGLGAIFSTYLIPVKEDKGHISIDILKKSFKKVIPTKLGELWHANGHKYLLIAIFLRKAAMTGVASMLAVFVTTVRDLSNAQMGLIVGVGPAIQVLFMVLFGKLVDGIGRKEIYTLGFLACSTVPVIYSFSSTFYGFMVGSAVLGISFSAITAGTTAFIGDIAPHSRQGEILGVRKTIQGISGVFGGLIGGIITSVLGFNYMFYSMSLLMIFGTLIAFFYTTKTMNH